jgi:GNAT superfamily N-acetyltransferase
MVDFNIRKATEGDVQYFFDSIQSTYNTKLDSIIFHERFKSLIKNKNAMIFVAYNNLQNIVGSIICEKKSNLADGVNCVLIKEFYITPKYRKLNIADKLYEYIETKAASLSIYKVEVLCNINATTTQSFYMRKKFKSEKKLYTKIF